MTQDNIEVMVFIYWSQSYFCKAYSGAFKLRFSAGWGAKSIVADSSIALWSVQLGRAFPKGTRVFLPIQHRDTMDPEILLLGREVYGRPALAPSCLKVMRPGLAAAWEGHTVFTEQKWAVQRTAWIRSLGFACVRVGAEVRWDFWLLTQIPYYSYCYILNKFVALLKTHHLCLTSLFHAGVFVC